MIDLICSVLTHQSPILVKPIVMQPFTSDQMPMLEIEILKTCFGVEGKMYKNLA